MEIESRPEKTAGAYTFAEAARILWATRPPPDADDGRPKSATGSSLASRLRYWVNTGVIHDGLVKHPGPEKWIHFQALVSLRIVYLLSAKGVSLPTIRRGEQRLRADLEVPWPFAAEPFWRRQPATFPKFAAVIAAAKGGRDAAQFLEHWLDENANGLRFNDHGSANAWQPAQNVLLHGGVASGQPCVAGRRILAWVIHSLFEQGESVTEIAWAYDLTERQVSDVVAWGNRFANASF